jgi:hypothetical protein
MSDDFDDIEMNLLCAFCKADMAMNRKVGAMRLWLAVSIATNVLLVFLYLTGGG